MNFSFHIPTKIHFGPGTLGVLATEKLPGRRALLVISAGGSVKRHGTLERVTTLLAKANVECVVFDKILSNPIHQHVMQGAQLAKDEHCDFVIGLGGGSSIDSAKSIALMATNPGDYWHYIHGGSGQGRPLVHPPLPIVAITTTAGTGTEADPWTVITHEELHEKIGFGVSPDTFPVLSIVDPCLMLTVPPELTAFQGFDAFFHAAEGYIAKAATPLSDGFALQAIELLAKWLPVAVHQGGNLEARSNVALANTLAGLVESTSSCTSEHSIEHALSAAHPELAHGAGLILLSNSYFRFFAEKAPARIGRLAEVLGVDTRQMRDTQAAHAFVLALHKLQQACGVGDLKMSTYGIKKADAAGYAHDAIRTMGGLFHVDPYTLNEREVTKIIADACK